MPVRDKDVIGLVSQRETYHSANQRNKWFGDRASECVSVVGRYLTPFVEVEQLAGQSNDWMGKMELVVLRNLRRRRKEAEATRTEPGITSWRYDPSTTNACMVSLTLD